MAAYLTQTKQKYTLYTDGAEGSKKCECSEALTSEESVHAVPCGDTFFCECEPAWENLIVL